jgi:membrane-associated phospholipid phosphatase
LVNYEPVTHGLGREALDRRLIALTAIGVVSGAALIGICYLWIDRPVAWFVHDHRIPGRGTLVWATYSEPILEWLAPATMVVLAIRRASGRWRRSDQVLFAAALAVLVASALAEAIKPVFGRYWPETWIDDNPSLIRDGAYGFHPFHMGGAYGSFPSGHTTVTSALAAVMWFAWPRGRVIWVALVALVAAGLLANNYHFVGDVIAGTLLGSICGTWAFALLAASDSTRKSP